MRALQSVTSNCLPSFAQVKTYAAHPVWKGSARTPVRFVPMARRDAVRLFHEARRFERATRKFRKQDGSVGRNGILLLQAMLFDCLNHKTGRLDPSYRTLARLAHISIRSVARGLQKLKAAGIINWVRRCAESIINGQWCLEQESNAYAVIPPTQWHGYRPKPPLQRPEAGTWGDQPPIPSALEGAADAVRNGYGSEAAETALRRDPGDALAAAVARLRPGKLPRL